MNSDTSFRFPDVADFPDNHAPVNDNIPPVLDWHDDFDGCLKELFMLTVSQSRLDQTEAQILQNQLRRVSQAEHMYHALSPINDGALAQEGVIGEKLDTDPLLDFFYDDIRDLLARPSEEPEIDKIDSVTVRKDEAATKAVTEYLNQGRLLKEASHYRGRELKVRDVTVQVSRPSDRHHYQQFRDCETVTRLLNLHVDPKPGITKAIIYLGEVDDSNGPFQSVSGSHHWRRDEIDQIFAWGNSVGNYCHTPGHRRAANALPKPYRGNAIIGRLIPDDSDMCQFIEARLESWPSEKANTLVFDPCFLFHRGGLCKTRTRVNLQARLA